MRSVAMLGALACAAACGGDRVGADQFRDQPATATATVSTPVRSWTVTAPLISHAGEPLRACSSTDTSLPPGCGGGVVVRGVDPMQAPGAERFPNGTVTTDSVRLVGEWDGAALTVTEPAVAATAQDSRQDVAPLRAPCDPPPGGWQYDRVDQAGIERAVAYAQSQPDADSPFIEHTQRVIVLRFTGELERHRHAVALVYDGPVCIARAKASTVELERLRDTVTTELEAQGVHVFGSLAGTAREVVEVIVDALDPEGIRALERRYPHLEVSSFLQPLTS